MKKNVAEVTKLSEKLIEILLEALLKESDSFVYLSAIQALVETINRAPVTSNNTRYTLTGYTRTGEPRPAGAYELDIS